MGDPISTAVAGKVISPVAEKLLTELLRSDDIDVPEDALSQGKTESYNGFIELIRDNIKRNDKFLGLLLMGFVDKEFYEMHDLKIKKDKKEYIELIKAYMPPSEAITEIEESLFGIQYRKKTKKTKKGTEDEVSQ